MWIKNLNVYLGREPFAFDLAEIEEKLGQATCPPCGSQAESSEGFVTPLKQDGRMVIAAEGFLYCMYQETVRILPGPVIKEELDERTEALAEKEGRRIGRKEKAELKEQIVFELLPRAFTRSRQTPILIDLERNRLLVDTASATRAEQAVEAMRRALGSLPVSRPVAPGAADIFSGWLKNPSELPANFGLGDRCELKDIKGEGASVRFTAVDLGQEDVLSHLESMAVVRLNLSFRDEVEVDLLEDFSVKRIKPLDVMQENIDAVDADDAVDSLLADISLQGGSLRALLDQLFDYFDIKTSE